MLRIRFAIILMLLIVLSHPVFPDQEACKQTSEFKLGVEDGENQKYRLLRSIGWAVLSTQLIAFFAQSGMLVGWLAFPDPDYAWGMGYNVVFGALAGAGIGTALSIAIPSLIVSKPKVVPDYVPPENVDCYLEGYATETRRNRVRGASVGCAVVWIFATIYIGAEMLMYNQNQ
jgi:hypothetical protein